MIVIDKEKIMELVKSIVGEADTKRFLKELELCASFVKWEDTARHKGSCWGPNISDMTLCVDDGDSCGIDMPIIGNNNFTDKTFDIPIENITLKVGNESGTPLETVTLRHYLENLHLYTDQGKCDLYDERDTVVLASSQCCMLPCEKGGKTEFAVKLYNYQTTFDNPAVLVIVSTSSGTSAQVLNDNSSSLLFNNNGMAHNFAIERLTDVREKRTGKPQKKVKSHKEMTSDEQEENFIKIFQVPLVVENSRSFGMQYGGDLLLGLAGDGVDEELECAMFCDYSTDVKKKSKKSKSLFRARGALKSIKHKGEGMDMGNISTGELKGPFSGTRGLKLVRDKRYPIRYTMQCYRVTDENFITSENVTDIKDQLEEVLKSSVASGSLVTSKTDRKTEPVLQMDGTIEVD